MKKRKAFRSNSSKAENVSEPLNTDHPETKKADDFELTNDQLDVVNGGTINPGITGEGEDEIFESE